MQPGNSLIASRHIPVSCIEHTYACMPCLLHRYYLYIKEEVVMTHESVGFEASVLRENLETLAANPYPGRGIVLGVSPSGEQAVQAYWVMGRSENSRNRVLRIDEDTETGATLVKTEAHDPDKVEDPSLIIYNALRTATSLRKLRTQPRHDLHVVSNGNQTDTVVQGVESAHNPSIRSSFIAALLTREFEPDSPNFTPRITGLTHIPSDNLGSRYHYSIIRRNPTTGGTEHTFGEGDIDDIPTGAGICFHTYAGDGNPLPAFAGSPYAISVQESAVETAQQLWSSLDEANRVALVVKNINRTNGVITHATVNALDE